MKLSVIIPVYNAEKYIDRCIQSILRQELDDIEIICVDDGSTDATLDLLNYYASNNPQVKVIRQVRQYAGIARNVGLIQATGEYIHFLDADDYLLENVYGRLLEIVTERKLDCLKFKNKCFSVNSGEQKEQEYSEYVLDNIPHEFFVEKEVSIERDIKMLVRDVSHTPWSGIYRREFLLENNINFNDLICVNDRSFFISVIIKAKRISFADIYVVNHQMDNAGSLIGIRLNNFECHYENFDIVKDIVKNEGSTIQRIVLNDEVRDILAWYNSIPDGEKKKEERRLLDFLDGLNWELIERDEAIEAEIRKDELLCPDVSGEIYYLYSKLKSQGKYLVDVLESLDYKSIYIYGVGEIGRILIEDLKLSNSSVIKGVFDKKAEDKIINIGGDNDISVKAPKDIPNDNIPIIITPSKNYKEIKKNLEKLGNSTERLKLLDDLLNDYFNM